MGEPVSRIEALLPTSVARAPARAVWTGQALLVAGAAGDAVILRRYACVDGRFVRTDPL
jgi:hypothetical protein